MIHLDGVAIPEVDGDYLDFKPFDHQAKAQEIIKTEDEFFAVNTSPTGSGKTYSWLKPALEEGIDSIAVFPTNALIADQFETVEKLIDSEFRDSSVLKVTGETVSTWQDESRGSISKGRALRRRFVEALQENRVTIVLTNPDIFTLMRKDMYRHPDVQGLPERFEMLVFDEFHLADVRQRDLLLFLVDELSEKPDERSRLNKYYFLSATPGDSNGPRGVEERIKEDMEKEVWPIGADAVPLSDAGENYTSVMPKVDLELRSTQTFRTKDRLLSDEVFADFVDFCEEEQTVVMLDGVHEVDEVYRELRNNTNAAVRRLTGFSDEKAREKISDFDILVSNSAVEVGLDFKPERLVFSASDASSLIQRLGRLRKLKERTEPHRVWCYVPESVKAKLETEMGDDFVDRENFEGKVKATFANKVDLSSYSTRWSEKEAYHHVNGRVENVPSEAIRQKTLQEGLQRIERHFYEPFDRSFEEEDLRRLHDNDTEEFVNELKTYRGSGLQVMIRDHEADEMKLYNMLHLLSWGRVDFFDPNDFRSRLSAEGKRFYDAYEDYSIGFCEYYGKIPSDDTEEYSGRTVLFKSGNARFHEMVENTSDREREPKLLSGLDVKVESNDAPSIQSLDYLRDELSEAKRLVYLVPGNPSSNQALYGFGDFFFVYPFFRQNGNATITFGTTALYLDCLVQDRIEEKQKERDYRWD